MDRSALKELWNEELIKKKKSTKVLVGLFIPIIIGLNYFIIRDYISGEETDMSSFIIMICTIGGLVSMLPKTPL